MPDCALGIRASLLNTRFIFEKPSQRTWKAKLLKVIGKLYPKVAHSWFNGPHNDRPLACQVASDATLEGICLTSIHSLAKIIRPEASQQLLETPLEWT